MSSGAVGVAVAIGMAIVSAGLGYLVGRRQEMDGAVRDAFLELQRLRDAPKLVRFRPKEVPPRPMVVLVPDEPGDHEWRQSIHHLKSLALYARDDEFFGLICDIEVRFEGFVGQARSVTMPTDNRHENQKRFIEELNKIVPAAECRLSAWQTVRGLWRASWRRRKLIRQPFISWY